jgi:hypothetical protein
MFERDEVPPSSCAHAHAPTEHIRIITDQTVFIEGSLADYRQFQGSPAPKGHRAYVRLSRPIKAWTAPPKGKFKSITA